MQAWVSMTSQFPKFSQIIFGGFLLFGTSKCVWLWGIISVEIVTYSVSGNVAVLIRQCEDKCWRLPLNEFIRCFHQFFSTNFSQFELLSLPVEKNNHTKYSLKNLQIRNSKLVKLSDEPHLSSSNSSTPSLLMILHPSGWQKLEIFLGRGTEK